MDATLARKSVLVTGANRGLGRALVREALRRGATRVYAGTRQPFSHRDPRVTPVMLDVTNETHIQRAIEQVASLDVLINNAGVAVYDDLSDRAVLERHLDVNLFGPWRVTQVLDQLPPIAFRNAEAAGTDIYGYLTELFGFTAFGLEDGVVYQTYSTTGRGVEFLMPYYGFLDHAPKGRDEGDDWQLWIRRHDEYDNDRA